MTPKKSALYGTLSPSADTHAERLIRFTDQQVANLLARSTDHLTRSALNEVLMLRQTISRMIREKTG